MVRREKRGEAETPENHERWLPAYLGMTTLLLALFIILYSMSVVDAKKFVGMTEQTGYQMGAVNNSAAAGGGTGNGNGMGIGSREMTTSAGSLNNTTDTLDEVCAILQPYAEKNHFENQISLVNTNTYVKIYLKDKIMFVPDSSRTLPESEPILREVTEAISKVYDRVSHITFNGYMADVGPHTLFGDQTFWWLSIERAAMVLTKAIEYGMRQDKVSIEDYAHSSSVANNNNEEGCIKNRRVEIAILRNPPIIPADILKPSPDSAASSATVSGQPESSKATH